MKTLRRILIFLTVLIFLLGGAGFFIAQKFLHYKNPETVQVYLQKGTSIRLISQKLAEAGVVSDARFFEAYVRLFKPAGALKSGEYEFSQDMDLSAVIEKLVSGDVLRRQFTIPEGYDLRKTGKLLADKGILNLTDFERFKHRIDWLVGIKGATTLEGFLFPDTYSYDSQTSPEMTVKNLVDNFMMRVGIERLAKGTAKGLSPLDVVTLASVIEKETGQANERPLIAGVFFNRLKLGMPLQSDPTVIYGITNFNGNLTRADLKRDHPYNTYTRGGLPIGPICSPGLEAIEAVLTPAVTDALYFVGKGDGSHYFSSTLDQHNQAVRYYQLHQGSEPQ